MCANFIQSIEKQLIKNPERVAMRYLIDGESREETLSRQQIRDKMLVRAKQFKASIGEGQVAVLIYVPGLDFVVSFLACLYAGVIPVPTYPPVPQKLSHDLLRLELICRDCAAKAIIADGTSSKLIKLAVIKDGFKSFFTQLIKFDFGSNEKDIILKKILIIVTGACEDEVSGDKLELMSTSQKMAFLQYSSGSTGNPKGVVITHENLIINCQEMTKKVRSTQNSIGLSWLPHYHDMGLIGAILVPLSNGNEVILFSPLKYIENPIRWLKAITKYRPTHIMGASFGYELCLKKLAMAKAEDKVNLDLSSLEVVLCGAEPIDPKLPTKLFQALKKYGYKEEAFTPGYGLAEYTLLASLGKPGKPCIKAFNLAQLQNHIVEVSTPADKVPVKELVSCGTSLDNHEIQIVDPVTRRIIAHKAIGEIWLKGKSVAQGYWHKEKESEETFNAYTADNQGPFLRTGDLGFLDDGEVYIYGRIKDIIIIRGKKYAPHDIEFSIQNAHPQIKGSSLVVFSVEHNNEEKIIVLAEVKGELNYEEIYMAILKMVVNDHGIGISEIVLVKPKSIPKTISGKIQRHAGRQAYLNQTLPIVATWRSSAF